jgi:hypothetical protein
MELPRKNTWEIGSFLPPTKREAWQTPRADDFLNEQEDNGLHTSWEDGFNQCENILRRRRIF